jgi:hypothetical protein
MLAPSGHIPALLNSYIELTLSYGLPIGEIACIQDNFMSMSISTLIKYHSLLPGKKKN